MGGKPPMVEGPIVLETLTAMVTAPLAGLAGQGGWAGCLGWPPPLGGLSK